jgi:hypothetical protein
VVQTTRDIRLKLHGNLHAHPPFCLTGWREAGEKARDTRRPSKPILAKHLVKDTPSYAVNCGKGSGKVMAVSTMNSVEDR